MNVFVIVALVVVAAGIALFVGAEVVDNRHVARPQYRGRERAREFFDDAQVLLMRLGGVTLVVGTLIAFVIAHHLPPR